MVGKKYGVRDKIRTGDEEGVKVEKSEDETSLQGGEEQSESNSESSKWQTRNLIQ